jgi:hypothetical protein
VSTPMTWLRIGWPRDVSPGQRTAAMRVMATNGGRPLVIEAVGNGGQVVHQIGTVTNKAGNLDRQLRSVLPGVAIKAEVRVHTPADRSLKLLLSTNRRALRPDDEGNLSRALLAALSATGKNESIVLQWTLGRRLSSEPVPSQLGSLAHETWYGEVMALPLGGAHKGDGEQRRALASKRAEPGWQAIGRIGVHAETEARSYQLVRGVLNALRLAEAPGVTLLARRTSPQAVNRYARPWHWPLRLNIEELATVSSWPLLSTIDQPVERTGSRQIPPSRSIPRRGRIVALANYSGRARPLGLSVSASLRHLHVLGPTGVGKSTLLLNLIEQDMLEGRSVVVIEPKGDLCDDILARVPEQRQEDVVLIEASDKAFSVGLNPLSAMGRSPDLVADHLLNVFHKLYAAHWGPRTQDILGAALQTLAQIPGSTLVGLPLLLTDQAFRRRMVAQISDPVALEPFWAHYEGLSDNERNLVIAPVLNKVRPFLMRPQLRAMLGQSRPRFDIREVFTGRKILLVNLSKGLLGAETSSLLGGLLISQLWQATLSRSAIEPARRHPVFITIDEFQDYLVMPTDLGDALGQARGLGVAFALAHQHLGQLDAATKAAVEANAQNKVAFRLAKGDARAVSDGRGMPEAEDFSSLGAFECYVQLVADGAVQPWTSAKTVPAPEAASEPDAIRRLSRERYGTPRAEVDAEVRALVDGGTGRGNADDLRPRRRPAGDGS